MFIMAVDHNIILSSNEAERANKDIYDDFKLRKNPLVSMVYIQIFHRCKGQVHSYLNNN